MRLSTDFWVSAYIRQSEIAGDYCALVRRGASQGGSVFVIVDHLSGCADLYGPAPQAWVDDGDDRVFEQLLKAVTPDVIRDKLDKEAAFDSDLWIVERASRAGHHGLTLIEKN